MYIDKIVININDREFKALKITNIFQNGFMFETKMGTSIEDLLTCKLAIDKDYVLKNISTVFLNGEPVDDIERATLEEGSVVALSEAMPGLAGAVLRRGSFYQSFRGSGEERKNKDRQDSKEDMVRIKLFNRVINRLGPALLKKGIIIRHKELIDFIEKQDYSLKRYESILINGKALDKEYLKKKSKKELVFFKVKVT